MRTKLLLSVVASTVLLLTACDSKTAEEYIAAAKSQYQNNDIQTAIIDLKNAIALAPKNKDARARLGEYYLALSLFVESEKELRKALELGEDKSVIYPNLVKAIYYQNDYDRLILLTNDFNNDDPKIQSSVDLYRFLADLKQTNETNEFDTDFPTLIGDDKTLAEVYYLFSQGKLEEADQRLSTFENPEQNQIEKLIVTGLVKAQLKKYDVAIDALEKVVAQSPEYYVIQFQLAEILIAAQDYEKARGLVEGLLKLNSRSAYANMLLAKIEMHDENYKEAFDASEITIHNGIDNTQSNLVAGISAFKIERVESAYKYLSKASKGLPKDHFANRLLADVKIRLGETDNLVELIEGISGQDVQKSSLLESAAMIKFREGDIDESTSLFDQAKNESPNSAVTLMREGLVKLSSGDQSGIESLEAAIELDDSLVDAWSLLAQAHMQAGSPEKALSVAKRWQDVNEVGGLVLESYILQQMNNDILAREKLEKALTIQPDNYSAMRFLMLLNAREKRYAEASDLAKKLLMSSNNARGKFQVILTLINLAIQQDDVESTESLFITLLSEAENEENTTDNLEIKVGLATVYNYQGEYQKALSILNDIKETKNFFALSTLGQTYVEMGDYNNANNTYRTLVNTLPKDSRSWIKLINFYNQYGRHSDAAKAASEAEKAIPHNSRLKVFTIRSLIRSGKISEAEKKIAQMKSKSESSLMFELFDGEIALHNKEYAKASELLTHYYSIEPSWDTAQSLAKALAHVDKAELGGKYLLEQTAQKRVKLARIHYIAEYFSRNGELEAAEKYYKGLMKVTPADLVTLNNYASLSIQLNKKEQAIELAQKALQVAPKSPYVMDTLGWALFKNQEYTESLTYIKKAHEALPKSNDVTLHLIEVLISTGSKEKAQELINRVKPATDKEEQTLTRLNASI